MWYDRPILEERCCQVLEPLSEPKFCSHNERLQELLFCGMKIS